MCAAGLLARARAGHGARAVPRARAAREARALPRTTRAAARAAARARALRRLMMSQSTSRGIAVWVYVHPDAAIERESLGLSPNAVSRCVGNHDGDCYVQPTHSRILQANVSVGMAVRVLDCLACGASVQTSFCWQGGAVIDHIKVRFRLWRCLQRIQRWDTSRSGPLSESKGRTPSPRRSTFRSVKVQNDNMPLAMFSTTF